MSSWLKWLGIIFVVLGAIFLLENLNIFLLNWSLYIILTGLALVLAYWINKDFVIFILPAVILLIYGLLFFYCQIAGWNHLATTWPILLIAPGLGFITMHLIRPNRDQYLYPGLILSGFGLLFFLRKIDYIKYWPALLILLGIYFLIKFFIGQEED